MRKTTQILLVCALVCWIGTVHAQSVSWKFVQAGWGSFDPDRASRQDGWLIGATGELGKIPIHVFGEFNDLGSYDLWQVGAGWHGLFGERADLFADGAYYDVGSDSGLRLRFGGRWMVSKRLELNGFLSWTNLDLTDNESASFGAAFDFSKRFAVGGAYEWGSNWSTARVFLRFNFGQRS